MVWSTRPAGMPEIGRQPGAAQQSCRAGLGGVDDNAALGLGPAQHGDQTIGTGIGVTHDAVVATDREVHGPKCAPPR